MSYSLGGHHLVELRPWQEAHRMLVDIGRQLAPFVVHFYSLSSTWRVIFPALLVLKIRSSSSLWPIVPRYSLPLYKVNILLLGAILEDGPSNPVAVREILLRVTVVTQTERKSASKQV